MRVLFLGHANQRYLKYLNNFLKSKYKATTGAIDLFQFERNKEDENKYDYLEKSTEYIPPKLSKVQLLQVVFKGVVRSKISLLLHAIIKFRLKDYAVQFVSNFFQEDRNEYYKSLIQNFNPSIIHLHYINKSTLRWLQFIPIECKIILTFWGSDLMDTSGGVEEYRLQYNAVHRADIITTQTLDTRTILLSKFGQNLLPKLKCVTFNPLEFKRAIISELDSELNRQSFLKKKNVLGKTTVLVGYSAAEGQNHFAILNSIDKLEKDVKEKIVCFVPLTYNDSSNYRERLLLQIKKLDLHIIPIIEYMSDREMMELVVYSKVFIAARNNDALNATMIESMYAQNVVITGAWLPYNMYKRLGCYYETVDNVNEIGNKLKNVISKIDRLKKETFKNKQIIDRLYSDEKIENDWMKVYDNL